MRIRGRDIIAPLVLTVGLAALGGCPQRNQATPGRECGVAQPVCDGKPCACVDESPCTGPTRPHCASDTASVCCNLECNFVVMPAPAQCECIVGEVRKCGVSGTQRCVDLNPDSTSADSDKAAWELECHEPPPTHTYCADGDGDGYCVESSCQLAAEPGPPAPPAWRAECGQFEGPTCDGDAASHPGVPEACNHVDDDCDGATDEGFVEVCNQVDDDCDGVIDEGCPPPVVDCNHRAPPLSWQCKRGAVPVHRPGPRPRCIKIREPADDEAAVWQDNSLCGPAALALQWSTSGRIAGKECVQVFEHAEDPSDGWGDNYLCWRKRGWQRPGTKLTVRWSEAGPITDMTCLRWHEPDDPDAWNDNYLCWTLEAVAVSPRRCHCLDGMCTDAAPGRQCQRVCETHGADSGHTHAPCR